MERAAPRPSRGARPRGREPRDRLLTAASDRIGAQSDRRARPDGPLTNRELSERLGEQPATVLYHVRTLARTGFIVPDRPRPGPRGSVEKPYRTTGKSWQLSVDVPGPREGVSRAALGAFLAELEAAGPRSQLSTTRLAFDATPAQLAEFQERLTELLDELLDDLAAASEPKGDRWSLFIAFNRRP